MTFLITVEKVTIGGSPVQKITEVEVLQNDPAESEVIHSSGEGKYLHTLSNDKLINKLLNDYGNVGVTVSVVGAVESLNLTFDTASEDPHSRRVLPANWEPKTRPALMRAATTTHFFNA